MSLPPSGRKDPDQKKKKNDGGVRERVRVKQAGWSLDVLLCIVCTCTSYYDLRDVISRGLAGTR